MAHAPISYLKYLKMPLNGFLIFKDVYPSPSGELTFGGTKCGEESGKLRLGEVRWMLKHPWLSKAKGPTNLKKLQGLSL